MAPPTTRKAEKDPTVTAPDADASAESTETSEQTSKESSSGTEYLNTSGGPLVYDKDGHMIGGGEWTPAINLDAIGKGARGAGHLLPRSAL